MFDGENMNNILHRDGDGLYICEEDIIKMWQMVNPTWQRMQRVRVKKIQREEVKMKKTIYNIITGETATTYGEEGEAPRVAMFIKCNRLISREAQEQKFQHIYEQINNDIIEVDHDTKIVFVDMETGRTISEI